MKSHHVIIFVLNTLQLCSTGMAQRQRAGLITPRSQDRNLLPVRLFYSTKTQKLFRRPPQLCGTVGAFLELVALHCGRAGSSPYTPGHYDVDIPGILRQEYLQGLMQLYRWGNMTAPKLVQALPTAMGAANYTNTNCIKQNPIKSVRIGIMHCISLLHLAAVVRVWRLAQFV